MKTRDLVNNAVIQIRLSEIIKEELKRNVASEGFNVSDKLRQLIVNYNKQKQKENV